MLPTIEQLKERMYRRAKVNTTPRYKFPYPAKAVDILTEAYKAELIRRRVNSPIDEATRQKIALTARWLTGDNKPGLFLYGTVGSGKTTLANAMCSMIDTVEFSPLESERKNVLRITASELSELRLKENDFNNYKTAQMLFIDDLGIESTTVKSYGNEFTPLIDILYYRYDRMLFTIMTSNLDEKGLTETYGLRTSDRINEMFDKISYNNASYRK